MLASRIVGLETADRRQGGQREALTEDGRILDE